MATSVRLAVRQRAAEAIQRKVFSCGEPALDRFLQQQAHQTMRRGVSQTFVLVPADAPAEIAGLHTGSC